MNPEPEVVLDEDQQRVAQAGAGERLYVVAGPGSGKTETVSARIAHLTQEEELTGDALLIISFSRAAVEAVQRRQRTTAPHSAAWVATLDSLASRLLTDAGIDVSGLGFDARIRSLLEGLNANEDITDQLRDVEHLIVDEVQDVVGIRADLLAVLLTALPATSGFTLLGDPLQGIYDFQLVPGSLTADTLRAKAISLGATEISLHGQYRAKTADATRAMASRQESGIGPWIHTMETHVNKMPRVKADQVADWITATAGSIAVLTQSNAQALVVTRELHSRGIPAELLGPATRRPLAPWIAGDLGDATGPFDFESFKERMSDTDDETIRDRWLTLRRLTRAKGRSLDVGAAAKRLAAGVVPVSLYSERRRVTVSTIHRAKGLEFDRVLLLDPKDWYDKDDKDAYARSLYVAITRPRHRLFTFSPPPDTRFWSADGAAQRVTRRPHGKKGIIGFEVRGSDWRNNIPPDATGEPARAQAILGALTPESRPYPVEVRFNPYDATSLRPSFDAFVDDQRIGTLGDDFKDDFVRRTGRCEPWPRLEGLFLVGAETVAGPAQHGSVGKNGLWLSPLIVGPASLNWRR